MSTAIPQAVGATSGSTLRDVRKVHGSGDAAAVALDGIRVGLWPGSLTPNKGLSRCGKSTLPTRPVEAIGVGQ